MIRDAVADEDRAIPIVEERAWISKEVVETGVVRVSTHVEEHEVVVDEALRHDEVTVERIPINRVVETAPAVRREGDTMIYSIVEETLVIEKRLLLKEEVRVTCSSRVELVEQQVTLRAMHADVQRFPTQPTQQD